MATIDQLLNLFDKLEMNELHRAVKENRLDAVKHLVSNGADIAYAIKGETPLRIATELNYHRIMEVLIGGESRDKVKKLINATSSDTGNAALHIAAKNNSIESVVILLKYGANYELNMTKVPARRPVDLTTDEKIKQLLQNIDEIFKLTTSGDNTGLVSKLESCPSKDLSAVMYARNSQGYTALQVAIENCRLDVLGTIVSKRIDEFHCSWKAGFNNLDKLIKYSKAVRYRFSIMKDILLSYEDDIKLHGCTRQHANRESVIDLLDNTFGLLKVCKEQGDKKFTEQQYLIIIDESLEVFGFQREPEVKDKRIKQFLKLDLLELVKLLELSMIAPMLLFMQSVYTSELLEAAKRNDLSLVEKCLSGHPDLNKIDSEGRTALRYARQLGNDRMIKLLMDFGAKDCE